jgi:hypothetical protein
MIENTFAVFLKMKSMPFLININDPKVYINNSGCLLVISNVSTSTKTERGNAIK